MATANLAGETYRLLMDGCFLDMVGTCLYVPHHVAQQPWTQRWYCAFQFL